MMRRKFTRRLVRLVAVRTSDGAGGYRESWQEQGAFWADVQGRSGGVRVTELGEEQRLRLKIVMHALPQGHENRPVSHDRLRDGARHYEVEAVHELDPKGRYLTCFARETTEGNGP